MQKQVIRYIFISLIIIFGSQTFAANEYNNELLKVDIDQTSQDTVKVNIYTEKPYKDKIIVNKRPDNKYVILLPETANSVTTKPDISGASALNDIDVKSHQYSSLPDKAYTKITIDGKKSLEIVPQAFTTKKASSTRQSNKRPTLSPQQVQTVVPQRIINQQRPVTTSDFVPSYERQRQINQQQNYIAIPQQTQTPNYTRNETSVQQYQTPRTVQPSIVSEQRQSIITAPVQQNNNQVEENTNNRENTNKPTEETVTSEKNNQAVDDATTEQLDNDISEDELAFFKKIIRFKQKVVRKVKKILSFRISFATFMTVLQLILLLALIKIISDLVKKVQSTTEPQPITKRLIHDSNETYEQAYPSYSNMDVYNSNRSTFEEDNKEGFKVTPLSAPSTFTGNLNQKNRLGNYKNTLSEQNDFYRPINELNKEDKMSIFDENSKDIEKTIFKNPLTPISKQDEETLFDEIEPEQENTPFSNNEYTDKRDDFFNYTNSSDSQDDFFIFEDEDEDENIQYQEDYLDDEEYEEDEDEEEYEYSEEEDYNEYDEEQEYNEEEDSYSASDDDNAEKPAEEATQSNPFEHLSVQSKYVIDSQRGFAQVNVDGIYALIGYIGSKISIIRKFKEEVNGTMQVRLNEQPNPETMIYIIKLGSYKTLVEVKPNSIRQLLDL